MALAGWPWAIARRAVERAASAPSLRDPVARILPEHDRPRWGRSFECRAIDRDILASPIPIVSFEVSADHPWPTPGSAQCWQSNVGVYKRSDRCATGVQGALCVAHGRTGNIQLPRASFAVRLPFSGLVRCAVHRMRAPYGHNACKFPLRLVMAHVYIHCMRSRRVSLR